MRDRMAHPFRRPSSIILRHLDRGGVMMDLGSLLHSWVTDSIHRTAQARNYKSKYNRLISQTKSLGREDAIAGSVSILAHHQANSICGNFHLSSPIHLPWEAGRGMGRNHQKTNSNSNPAPLWPFTSWSFWALVTLRMATSPPAPLHGSNVSGDVLVENTVHGLGVFFCSYI